MRQIRFIHISDTHIGPTKDFVQYGVNTYNAFVKVVDEIKLLPYSPEFIIHTGDVTANPHVDSYRLYSSVSSNLNIPIYYAAGNHDNAAMMKSELAMGEKVDLNTENLLYRFDLGNVRFLSLDGRGTDSIDPHGIISENQFKIIEEELEKSEKKVMIYLHFPLLSLDCPWIDTNMLLIEGMKLHELFVLHKSKIKGVLFGHVHRGVQFIKDDILYSSVGSTFMQFGMGNLQQEVTFEPHGRGYFNVITLSDTSLIVKEYSTAI